jgi:hypothetical protein
MTKENINVFYHVWQVEGWELLFQQQILSLFVSGLYDACNNIYICINGKYPLPIDLPKFIIRYNENQHNESSTLKELWTLCDYSSNMKVLYFHTKGLSYGLSRERTDMDAWRHYMEYYNIYKWKECVKKLDSYDVVGTEWIQKSVLHVSKQTSVIGSTGHYMGNFWWATSQYIKTLDVNALHEFDYFHKKNNIDLQTFKDYNSKDNDEILRFNSELWIGLNKPNYYSFEDFNMNFYCTNALNKMLNNLLIK